MECFNMLSGDENKPIGNSVPRKRKAKQEGKKAEPRRRKSAQQQDTQPDQLRDALEAISAAVTSTGNSRTGASPADSSPVVPVVPVATAQTVPVSYQTIANAYRNYTRQSLDQTMSFFEKLAGVRSLDKAFQLQTEFAKQAYEGFLAESQKIRELHSELARQRLKRWEGFGRTINPR
jgi:hypothetical protein